MIRLVALSGIPEIAAHADLAQIIFDAATRQQERFEPGCAVVVAQKIVSKAENRFVDLSKVTPSPLAEDFARKYDKDARLIEVILQQARRVIKMDRGVLVVETHHGLVCANAGVDVSNVPGECATLLPEDPDASAGRLRERLRALSGVDCAVVISDTFGRPWREGLVNVAIGAAGFLPMVDYRGRRDRHGRTLRGTIIASGDELAGAAGLLMGKSSGTPVVLVFGAPLEPGEGAAKEIIRPAERDLFR